VFVPGRECGGDQTIPVEPPVHVETFATHCTVTWKARPLPGFLTAVRNTDEISPTASAVVEDTSVAGRERCDMTEIDTAESVRYLRVDPDAPWTLSWERRTWPVVSVSGTPTADLCRRVHLRTTDCKGWSENAIERVATAIPER
jgi:hypothetical protein